LTPIRRKGKIETPSDYRRMSVIDEHSNNSLTTYTWLKKLLQKHTCQSIWIQVEDALKKCILCTESGNKYVCTRGLEGAWSQHGCPKAFDKPLAPILVHIGRINLLIITYSDDIILLDSH
jgi:hypothetical protein